MTGVPNGTPDFSLGITSSNRMHFRRIHRLYPRAGKGRKFSKRPPRVGQFAVTGPLHSCGPDQIDDPAVAFRANSSFDRDLVSQRFPAASVPVRRS